MTNRPLVSVLMTAFNREKYIEAAIKSVLGSSFSDFELIVVDDCSNDQTVAIVTAWIKHDNRVKLYVNEKNLGDYHNRNRAATFATGKYLKYLDSDDIIYPHGLELFVHYMEANPEIALGLSSSMIQHQVPFPIKMAPKQALRYHFFQIGFLDRGPSGAIIRRDVFDAIGGFSGKRMIGDTELWLRVACEYPVMILPPAFIYWRQHEEQEYRIGQASNIYLELYLPMIAAILSHSNCPLTELEKVSILKFIRMQSARRILSLLIKSRNINRALELTKKLHLNYIDFYNAVFRFKTKLLHEAGSYG